MTADVEPDDPFADVRARLDRAAGRTTAAMWDVDVRTGRISWEPRAAAVLAVPVDGLPTTTSALVALTHPEHSAALQAALDQLRRDGSLEVELCIGQGTRRRHLALRAVVNERDRRGRSLRAVGLVVDTTAERAIEEQLLRLVTVDALTGLPNRRSFDQALRSESRRCARSLEPLSIVMVDLDGFAAFNDAVGQLVADDALVTVAQSLTSCVNRAGDLLARFGGDAVAFVLPSTDAAGAHAVARRVVRAVRTLVLRDAPDRVLTVSVGTATWHPLEAPLRPAELLAHAEQALAAAKDAGKDRAIGWENALAARATFEAAIAEGLRVGEFELHYQPMIAIDSGAVVGFEALARWNRPGYGLLGPDAFIPAAEASSLICEIGLWALLTATTQLASWGARGLDPGGALRVAVNVSGRHLATPAIVADVRAALEAADIDAGQLEVEITETVLVDGGASAANLAELRTLGIRIAIDDFGTGHTSIGQLPLLPIDTLKIDRSFVTAPDPRTRALVTLIIGAAHAFDLTVVAEGVDTVETLGALRALECDVAQGFLLSEPLTADSVPEFLRTWDANRRPSPRPSTVPR